MAFTAIIIALWAQGSLERQAQVPTAYMWAQQVPKASQFDTIETKSTSHPHCLPSCFLFSLFTPSRAYLWKNFEPFPTVVLHIPSSWFSLSTFSHLILSQSLDSQLKFQFLWETVPNFPNPGGATLLWTTRVARHYIAVTRFSPPAHL